MLNFTYIHSRHAEGIVEIYFMTNVSDIPETYMFVQNLISRKLLNLREIYWRLKEIELFINALNVLLTLLRNTIFIQWLMVMCLIHCNNQNNYLTHYYLSYVIVTDVVNHFLTQRHNLDSAQTVQFYLLFWTYYTTTNQIVTYFVKDSFGR